MEETDTSQKTKEIARVIGSRRVYRAVQIAAGMALAGASVFFLGTQIVDYAQNNLDGSGGTAAAGVVTALGSGISFAGAKSSTEDIADLRANARSL